MKVFIVGVGYVGLVSAACLAQLGHEVCGADIDAFKIEVLKSGGCPIYEPGLEDLLKAGIASGRLKFQVGIDAKINNYDMAIIAVGTPERSSDGRANLYYIGNTARQIAENVTKEAFLVVGKSTVPIGTGEQIKRSLEAYNRHGSKFYVGSNPETLREGSAVYDFLHPERIIIGGDVYVQERLKELYGELDCPKILTDIRSAEMIKLVANTMLAMRISAANVVARLCDATGANVEEVMRGVGADSRIGRAFLRPGPGFGGSCFPKDTKNILRTAEYYHIDAALFEAIVRVNEEQWRWLCRKVEEVTLFSLNKKKVAVWGLAFKPETDDTREAPAIKIIRWLLNEGADVRVFDPVANVRREFQDGVTHCSEMYEAVTGAELLIIVTEWRQFREADLKRIKELMDLPVIVDGRNIYNPDTIRSLGFEYRSVGRP
jgi:UDPglucose 6-dehydrogenase